VKQEESCRKGSTSVGNVNMERPLLESFPPLASAKLTNSSLVSFGLIGSRTSWSFSICTFTMGSGPLVRK